MCTHLPRAYTDKDGVEKYATEIRGERMQMLGGKSDGERSSGQPAARRPAATTSSPQAASGGDFAGLDDDIPF